MRPVLVLLNGLPGAGESARPKVPDERLLADLLRVALGDAAADEVTPPIDGASDRTAARIDWFLAFHRDRRIGLDGPLQEATRAVVLDGAPVGGVRLRRLDDARVETGIRLARSVRGRGVGVAALSAVLAEACRDGASTVAADTATTNGAAQHALRRAAFSLRTRGDRVRAEARLTE